MKNSYVHAMVAGFDNEMKKIAGLAAEAKAGKGLLSHLTHPAVLGAGAGIVAYKTLSDAEKDRRLGRQMRQQNPGY